MPGFFDDQTLTLTCGQCGHETEHTVSRLKTRPAVICPKCGVVTEFNAAEFREGIRRAEKALDDFWKTLPKTIKLGH